MTKKDYILLADALKRSYPRFADASKEVINQWRADVLCIQNALAADNPKFDRSRFLKACGSPD